MKVKTKIPPIKIGLECGCTAHYDLNAKVWVISFSCKQHIIKAGTIAKEWTFTPMDGYTLMPCSLQNNGICLSQAIVDCVVRYCPGRVNGSCCINTFGETSVPCLSSEIVVFEGEGIADEPKVNYHMDGDKAVFEFTKKRKENDS